MYKTLAWHFVAGPEPHYRGGRPVVVGETLRHDGPLVMCRSGLHASVRAIDALQYSPGPWACLVECGGEIAYGTEKLVCTARTPLWCCDATEHLRLFARECAPDVVREYLETGAEELRDAAWGAAWDAARDAAWGAWGAARTKQNIVLESLLMDLPNGI